MDYIINVYYFQSIKREKYIYNKEILSGHFYVFRKYIYPYSNKIATKLLLIIKFATTYNKVLLSL